MAILAVTGEIGAGKSTVTDIFAKLTGYEKFSADDLAKDLWNSESAKNFLVQRYGEKILNHENNVDLKNLAQIIFNDINEYKITCKIIHPLVYDALKNLISNLRNSNAIVEVPLLFEAGRPEWVNYVIFVSSDIKIRLARVKLRGWDENELSRREKFFLDTKFRITMSDFVLENNSSLENLERDVKNIIEKIFSRKP